MCILLLWVMEQMQFLVHLPAQNRVIILQIVRGILVFPPAMNTRTNSEVEDGGVCLAAQHKVLFLSVCTLKETFGLRGENALAGDPV